MNLNTSQWLQITAIAISALISIARWIWDARSNKRMIQYAQNPNEHKDFKSLTLTEPTVFSSVLSRVAFFAPLAVLILLTLQGGELDKLNLGLMLLASIVFIGYLVTSIGSLFNGVNKSNAIIVSYMNKALDSRTEFDENLIDVVKSTIKLKKDNNTQ